MRVLDSAQRRQLMEELSALLPEWQVSWETNHRWGSLSHGGTTVVVRANVIALSPVGASLAVPARVGITYRGEGDTLRLMALLAEHNLL